MESPIPPAADIGRGIIIYFLEPVGLRGEPEGLRAEPVDWLLGKFIFALVLQFFWSFECKCDCDVIAIGLRVRFWQVLMSQMIAFQTSRLVLFVVQNSDVVTSELFVCQNSDFWDT